MGAFLIAIPLDAPLPFSFPPPPVLYLNLPSLVRCSFLCLILCTHLNIGKEGVQYRPFDSSWAERLCTLPRAMVSSFFETAAFQSAVCGVPGEPSFGFIGPLSLSASPFALFSYNSGVPFAPPTRALPSACVSFLTFVTGFLCLCEPTPRSIVSPTSGAGDSGGREHRSFSL